MFPKKLAVLFTLLLAISLSAPAFAKGGGEPSKRAKVEAQMKKLRHKVLEQRAGLDQAKIKKVEVILDRHAPKRAALQRNLEQHRKSIRKLLESDSNDQAAYERAIDGLRKAQDDLHALRNKEIDELRKVLTPKEQAKVVVSVRKLQRKLRQALRKYEQGAH